MEIEFAKGHGTRNDFVVILDPEDRIGISPDQVRFLCDRRGGIGADGILRLVRSGRGWDGQTPVDTDWFMDYRNADGSTAEMCGNGLRVALRYLAEEGAIGMRGSIRIATRAGTRTGRFTPDGQVAVGMGRPVIGATVEIALGRRSWPATAVDLGNPHAVVELADAAELASLDLGEAPRWSPPGAFPDGVNVEFVLRRAPGNLKLRVHERGVGETESCGTGVVAAAVAAGGAERVAVEVPGGHLTVELGGAEAVLIGPAIIVARGRIKLPQAAC